MKKYLATVALLGCLALLINTRAESQEPMLGETNPLIIACHTFTDLATDDGLVVKNCRRSKPDEITGHRITVHIRMMTNLGPFYVAVRLYKTLWMISTAIVEDA